MKQAWFSVLLRCIFGVGEGDKEKNKQTTDLERVAGQQLDKSTHADFELEK